MAEPKNAEKERPPSDYAVTRDLTDWLGQQRDVLQRLSAGKHPHGTLPNGQEPYFDPFAALAFATDLRKRVEVFEAHWRLQAEAKYNDQRAHVEMQLENMRRMLIAADRGEG